MTEQQISTALDELIATMAAGKPLEAFEKFYHDDLEKTDLDGVTHIGKAINEQVGIELLSKVKDVRDFTAVGKVVKGNRSFLIWSLDYDHADNGPAKVVEVAIQDWQDGKIIRERYVA
ncbi:MAG: nuclear transport factor 2 family protein [Bacteroidetes bacterium]|nr:nuclear transport factor 2 family protein [Fibrella sp.]